jgi:hypothetical protein
MERLIARDPRRCSLYCVLQVTTDRKQRKSPITSRRTFRKLQWAKLVDLLYWHNSSIAFLLWTWNGSYTRTSIYYIGERSHDVGPVFRSELTEPPIITCSVTTEAYWVFTDDACTGTYDVRFLLRRVYIRCTISFMYTPYYYMVINRGNRDRHYTALGAGGIYRKRSPHYDPGSLLLVWLSGYIHFY